ncbi:PKHD-type hydroxylase [Marinibacterium anthonyi]|nr:PKHD-type hydroxylase [Marinibacterium anthonyi]
MALFGLWGRAHGVDGGRYDLGVGITAGRAQGMSLNMSLNMRRAGRFFDRMKMLEVHAIPGAFSASECDAILVLAREGERADARLVGRARDHNLRRAELVWLDEVEGTDWIMGRIIDLVRVANRDVYGFDLTDFSESPQVARYGAEREGHFAWHADIGDGPLASRRKLTMVVQLSEDEDYEGGGLEVMPSAQAIVASRARGSATLFPSFLLHRVTPVTAGERHSLTIWAHGPAFR